MVVENNKQFLQPDSNNNYSQYKEWINGVNSTGKQIEPDTVSDERVKKFITNSVDGDDILRKIMMLNFVSNGIIDKSLADIYILKRMIKG